MKYTTLVSIVLRFFFVSFSTDCVKVVSQENGDNTAVEGGTTQQIDGGAPEVEKEADTKKDTEKSVIIVY